MNKIGVITPIIVFVMIMSVVFYVYWELSKKALENLKKRSTKIIIEYYRRKHE